MCLPDAGHASFICALVLGDEVQDGSGENKTAPWRLQRGEVRQWYVRTTKFGTYA